MSYKHPVRLQQRLSNSASHHKASFLLSIYPSLHTLTHLRPDFEPCRGWDLSESPCCIHVTLGLQWVTIFTPPEALYSLRTQSLQDSLQRKGLRLLTCYSIVGLSRRLRSPCNVKAPHTHPHLQREASGLRMTENFQMALWTLHLARCRWRPQWSGWRTEQKILTVQYDIGRCASFVGCATRLFDTYITVHMYQYDTR